MKWRRVQVLLLAIIGCALMAGLLVPAAAAQKVEDINAAIALAGGHWVAKENPISRMAPEARRMLLGAMRESAGPEAAEPPATAFGALPSQFDWRNYSGGDYVTGVRNQGSCGSCWAFAPTAALESKYLITNNLPGGEVDLCEQIVLSCVTDGDCGGGYASSASNFLRDTGTAVESCYPYTQTKGNCGNACANWQDDTYYFTSWSYVNSNEVATASEIKNAVYNYGPVVAWMQVYTDFFYYSSGVYSYSSGSYEGNHFVLVIGWDDGQNALICKNSWGTGWGESGFFKIAYTQLSNSVYFGYWTYRYGSAYGPSVEWTTAYPRILPKPNDLPLLRDYRDKVLAGSLLGDLLLTRLYADSPALLRVLLTHPRLMIQARKLVDANRDALAVAAAGGVAEIEDTETVLRFLDDLAASSPAGLRAFLEKFRGDMDRHRQRGEPFLGFFLR